MTRNYNNRILGLVAIVMLLGTVSCQKLYRPELGEIIEDPTPPPYNSLKDYWAFEDNLNDQGENNLRNAQTSNISYVAGVNGKAVDFGGTGYIFYQPSKTDTVMFPNEFVSYPGDTLAALGSYTVSFWMNVPGPVTGGAQGVFSLSNKNQFWGNLDVFLENNDNGDELFLKVHMFNKNISGGGEQWNEIKIPGVLSKWSHIAITYDASSSQFSIYADGQPTGIQNKVLGGGTYGPIAFNDFNGIVLGSFQFQTNPTLSNHGPESWARSVNGALDQFRIYNRALSQAEITTLFNGKE